MHIVPLAQKAAATLDVKILATEGSAPFALTCKTTPPTPGTMPFPGSIPVPGINALPSFQKITADQADALK